MDINFLEKEVINVWITGDETEESINRRFKTINQQNQVIYDFVLTYYNYFKTRRNYGNNHKFTMIEAHVLTHIVDNPGVTVSKLAEEWGRTRSALSQTVKKLINWGYVTRINNEEDFKYYFLHPTDKAKKFALIHKQYDNTDTVKLFKRLLKKFSPMEIETFFSVLNEYINLLHVTLNKE